MANLVKNEIRNSGTIVKITGDLSTDAALWALSQVFFEIAKSATDKSENNTVTAIKYKGIKNI